jgi:hypothetical protein
MTTASLAGGRSLVPENNHIRIPTIPGLCTGLINRVHDFYWERRLGVSTSGRCDIHYKDAERYEAVPYVVYFRLFEHIGLGPGDVAVDLGSGEGRMVCAAALYPIKKVIGVEIDAALHEKASANVARIRGARAPMSVVCQSATEFNYDEVTALFMFNPFGATTLLEVMDQLQASLARNPRTVRIVYLNGVWSHLLVNKPWLELYDQWKMSPWSRIKSPVHFFRTIAPTAEPL